MLFTRPNRLKISTARHIQFRTGIDEINIPDNKRYIKEVDDANTQLRLDRITSIY